MFTFIMFSINVAAKEYEGGSVLIRIPSGENEDPTGIEFYICQVADIVEGQYILRKDCDLKDIDLNKIGDTKVYREAASRFSKCSAIKKNAVTIKTDSNGEALIDNLKEGVYYIYSNGSKEYGNISSSIISIPTHNEINDTMEYNVVCEPKITKDITEKPKTGDNLEIQGYMFVCLYTIIIIMASYIVLKRYKSLDKD